MHGISLLQDLAVVMIIAGFVTILCHRFKQPVVLGYIIAGVIIGPHTPPFPLIRDQETINTFAELGVILLMFSLGLEFSLKKLRQVGGTALIAAFSEILLMVWVGYEIGRVFGWSSMDSLFLGAMLSISSTTIIVKALGELGKTKERFAQLIFGILIIEDILAIAMIALLSGIAMTGSLDAVDVGKTLGKLGMFLAASLVVGLLSVPRLLTYVARFKSNEMLLVTVLGLCFGSALLAVKLGYSVALGAFIIGAVMAESREIHRIEHLIEPVRDMFSALFFVAIGLLIDPGMLASCWAPIVVITLAVVVGKVVTCTFGAFVGGHDTRTSLRVGMGLAQIGEFSFIMASLGLSLGVTSKFLYPIAVAVSALTTLFTPYLIRSADGLVHRFDRLAPASLVQVLGIYTDWAGRLGQRHPSLAAKLMRRWMWQMALNAALIGAVFVAAASVVRTPPAWLAGSEGVGEGLKAVLWIVAAVVSLPMFIASSRKLQAVGLLVAETKVSVEAAGERTAAIRSVVAHVIPIAGTSLLGLFVVVLSATFLPTFKVFLVLLLLAGLISWWMRRFFIRVYSKAQIELESTLRSPLPAKPPEGVDGALPTLLRGANLRSCTLEAGRPAVGMRIRELRLRTLCGASIVAIDRGGSSLVNPGPEEELQAGDHVMLLGNEAQLEVAVRHLAGHS
jgi:CPA2 family monovalent cation:H+ antiporter-2